MNSSLKIQLLEGILFLKGKTGIRMEELKTLVKFNDLELEQTIEQINDKYKRLNSPMLIKINGHKIRMSLNKETSDLISKKLNKPLKIKLTKSTIEVLTIISYYQPITSSKIAKIRKANSDYLIQKLQALELIEAKEHAPTPGNPRLWTTTDTFLEAFDLEKISDLPDYESKKSLEESLLQNLDSKMDGIEQMEEK